MAAGKLRAVRAAAPTPERAASVVPMPRFRTSDKAALTTTEIVRAVLRRARPGARPFGVFVFAGKRMAICGTETRRFESMSVRYPNALVGTYDASLTVTGLMGDLQGFCEIEGALP